MISIGFIRQRLCFNLQVVYFMISSLNHATKSRAIYSIGTWYFDWYRPYNFRTDLVRNTIRRQGPLAWNGIERKIWNSSSSQIFKNKYHKEYLLLLCLTHFMFLVISLHDTWCHIQLTYWHYAWCHIQYIYLNVMTHDVTYSGP